MQFYQIKVENNHKNKIIILFKNVAKQKTKHSFKGDK